jgi:hypothetical protein
VSVAEPQWLIGAALLTRTECGSLSVAHLSFPTGCGSLQVKAPLLSVLFRAPLLSVLIKDPLLRVAHQSSSTECGSSELLL